MPGRARSRTGRPETPGSKEGSPPDPDEVAGSDPGSGRGSGLVPTVSRTSTNKPDRVGRAVCFMVAAPGFQRNPTFSAPTRGARLRPGRPTGVEARCAVSHHPSRSKPGERPPVFDGRWFLHGTVKPVAWLGKTRFRPGSRVCQGIGGRQAQSCAVAATRLRAGCCAFAKTQKRKAVLLRKAAKAKSRGQKPRKKKKRTVGIGIEFGIGIAVAIEKGARKTSRKSRPVRS